jgi:hypothetical protein
LTLSFDHIVIKSSYLFHVGQSFRCTVPSMYAMVLLHEMNIQKYHRYMQFIMRNNRLSIPGKILTASVIASVFGGNGFHKKLSKFGSLHFVAALMSRRVTMTRKRFKCRSTDRGETDVSELRPWDYCSIPGLLRCGPWYDGIDCG